eukprot:gene5806-11106_t
MANIDRVNEILYAYNSLVDVGVGCWMIWSYFNWQIEMFEGICTSFTGITQGLIWSKGKFKKEDVYTMIDALHLPPEIRRNPQAQQPFSLVCTSKNIVRRWRQQW